MPTPKQKIAFSLISENIRNPKPDVTLGKTMLQAGYSQQVALKPKLVTESKGFRELMEAAGLDDDSLTRTHSQLLRSSRLDHMVFPLETEDEPEEEKPPVELEPQPQGGALKRQHKKRARSHLSDDDIRKLLADVNCTVRRIVHGETARHVYFWAPDNKARKEALDMAYKLKGSYAPEKKAVVHAHFGQANSKTKEVVERFEEELKKTLME